MNVIHSEVTIIHTVHQGVHFIPI